MGILEQKRRFKNNVVGDTIQDLREKAKEEKEKSSAVIDLNKVRKNIKNSEFDIRYNDLKNDLKYQDLQDTYTNKQCNMMVRQSRNESKLNIIKKDTSNILTNRINVIFSILSGILSMSGVVLSYYKNNSLPEDAKTPCVIFCVLMLAVTLSNSCYVQNKLFDLFRLKKDSMVYVAFFGYTIACVSCLVISIITNRISMNKLLINCNLNESEKTLLSLTFTVLFDLVPLLNNSIKFYFNMCLYNQKTNDLFTDKEEHQTEQKDTQKNTTVKTFQNTINTEFEEPRKTKIGFINQEEKTSKKTEVKPGRKTDKRTINNIKNKIDKLESGERITNKAIGYNGSRKTLKDVCKNHLNNIEYRKDAKGNELMYKM